MKKKVILPSICFAVLSTVAFNQAVQATENTTSVTASQITSTQTVNVASSSTLNLRASASASAAILASLANGTKVSVHSIENGWAKVTANGKTGFVSSKFLKEENKTTSQYVKVSDGSKLNLRASASTSGAILASLANGAQVTVHSNANGWAKITASGKTGFVSSQFLSASNGSSTSSPPPAKEENKTSTSYVKVQAGSKLNLRASASTSGAILASLANGTQVTVHSNSNGWAKITASGKTGFVSSQFLSASNGSSTSSPPPAKKENKTSTSYVKVQAGSKLNLRASASTSGAILASLANGTQVTVHSNANGWAKITTSGKTGFVSSQFLSASNGSSTSSPPPAKEENKTSTSYVKVQAGSKLNLRASASTSGAILASLANGTQVTVHSNSNGWAKITASGKTGFVSSQFLSASNGSSTSSPPPAKEENKTSTSYVKVQAGSKLNLRASASTSGAILASLANGTQVTVHSNANGWAKITASGKTGFVSSQFLSASNGSSTSSPPPAKEENKTSTSYVKVQAGSKLNLRASASTSGAILASLANGTQVTVHSNANGWAKITASGKTGFVSSQFLSASNGSSTSSPPPAKEEVIVKAVNVSSGSSLNMRNKPNTNASVIVKLAKGVEVTVLSEQNGWTKIKVYGQEGYVSSEYLSIVQTDSDSKEDPEETVTIPEIQTPEANEPVTPPGTVDEIPPSENTTIVKYVNVSQGSSLNMRSNPTTSGSILTKLPRGTLVTVHSEENGWAKVTVNGLDGYISTQYLVDQMENSQDSSKRIINTTNTQYKVTLEDFTLMQMLASPQTDTRYATYIREDALILNDPANPTSGKVQGAGWKTRGGPGTNHWVVGSVKNGDTLQILSSTKGNDGYTWYQIGFTKSWVNASPDDVKKYLDPKNFINDPVASFQFLKLSETTSLDPFEVNEKILSGKGVLAGHAATFATASEKYGVNEIYLMAHALLETGNGTSQLAKGVELYGKTVYNMFGIGAFDQTAVSSGASFAYNAGWFTPEAAIIGGAQFIAQSYINKGQDTLYKMRWNPELTIATGVPSHQYATDIGWASKQVNQIYNLYNMLDSYQLKLDIPNFK